MVPLFEDGPCNLGKTRLTRKIQKVTYLGLEAFGLVRCWAKFRSYEGHYLVGDLSPPGT